MLQEGRPHPLPQSVAHLLLQLADFLVGVRQEVINVHVVVVSALGRDVAQKRPSVVLLQRCKESVFHARLAAVGGHDVDVGVPLEVVCARCNQTRAPLQDAGHLYGIISAGEDEHAVGRTHAFPAHDLQRAVDAADHVVAHVTGKVTGERRWHPQCNEVPRAIADLP